MSCTGYLLFALTALNACTLNSSTNVIRVLILSYNLIRCNTIFDTIVSQYINLFTFISLLASAQCGPDGLISLPNMRGHRTSRLQAVRCPLKEVLSYRLVPVTIDGLLAVGSNCDYTHAYAGKLLKEVDVVLGLPW